MGVPLNNVVAGNAFTTQQGRLTDPALKFLQMVGMLSQTASSAVPATSTSIGTPGQLAYDAGFLYVCVAPNVWKRVAIATF